MTALSRLPDNAWADEQVQSGLGLIASERNADWFTHYQAMTFRMASEDARRNARFALRSGLPGRMIYFRAEMQRAIRKWRQYAEAMRASL